MSVPDFSVPDVRQKVHDAARRAAFAALAAGLTTDGRPRTCALFVAAKRSLPNNRPDKAATPKKTCGVRAGSNNTSTAMIDRAGAGRQRGSKGIAAGRRRWRGGYPTVGEVLRRLTRCPKRVELSQQTCSARLCSDGIRGPAQRNRDGSVGDEVGKKRRLARG